MQRRGKIVTADRAILAAAVALGLLQLVVFVHLYATRIPALIAARVRSQDINTAVLTRLPDVARNAAANYNNLFEAPTLFFALCGVAVLSGHADGVDAALAWAYVCLRILHSLIHTTVNIVLLRFSLFSLSWLALSVLLVRCACHLLTS